MNWRSRIRQTHRWLSVVFTVAVIINLAAGFGGEPELWVGLLALIPLILLLVTGLYLFVLPYATSWRRARDTSASAG